MAACLHVRASVLVCLWVCRFEGCVHAFAFCVCVCVRLFVCVRMFAFGPLSGLCMFFGVLVHFRVLLSLRACAFVRLSVCMFARELERNTEQTAILEHWSSVANTHDFTLQVLILRRGSSSPKETKSKTEATAPSFGDTKHDNHAPKYRQVDILQSSGEAVLPGLAEQVHVVSAASQAWLNKQQRRSHSVRT